MRSLSKNELACISAGNITAAAIEAYEIKLSNAAIGAVVGGLLGFFIFDQKFTNTLFGAITGAVAWWFFAKNSAS